jgi:hypothetical protein
MSNSKSLAMKAMVCTSFNKMMQCSTGHAKMIDVIEQLDYMRCQFDDRCWIQQHDQIYDELVEAFKDARLNYKEQMIINEICFQFIQLSKLQKTMESWTCDLYTHEDKQSIHCST